MCSPTLFISIASQGMKMVAARRENRAAQAQAIEQNRIAMTTLPLHKYFYSHTICTF